MIEGVSQGCVVYAWLVVPHHTTPHHRAPWCRIYYYAFAWL